jgi:hypothetical protein
VDLHACLHMFACTCTYLSASCVQSTAVVEAPVHIYSLSNKPVTSGLSPPSVSRRWRESGSGTNTSRRSSAPTERSEATPRPLNSRTVTVTAPLISRFFLQAMAPTALEGLASRGIRVCASQGICAECALVDCVLLPLQHVGRRHVVMMRSASWFTVLC